MDISKFIQLKEGVVGGTMGSPYKNIGVIYIK